MGLAQYLFGISSEDRAIKFLKNSGYKIVCRNFHSRFGEIDIVAYDRDGILCFIEVKATNTDLDASYRLTNAKYAKILKTIEFYMLKNRTDADFEISLLVINKNKIELIRNISL
ncbi:hypothetical protein LMG7974_00926 [Campylobacter majalis]|uniref:UPF0102 protein LMG7974_00926 n=1 Tax=Campylobacter majalis TaxID=2790656 RepID=A0ABN7K701_9BACT|nr:YraN family protein [Campylobacter majalis]CAD7288303.1 hypothetical protein LMG7974_00926 [Campylobacter majalis]